MDTLVIGLDGGEWDVINPMIDTGELPNIAELKQEGVSGPLESITPPVSPPAWTSIQTGTNPGKHGIFDFSTFDEDYNRRSINSSDRSATPFWRVMNNEGVSTGLFKVPFTYPPGDVDGYLVTGFPVPNTVEDFATPESLVDRVGPVDELFEDWSLQQSGDFAGFKRNLIRVAERQTDLFLELIRDHETDFSMIVYDGSDRVQHFFWRFFDDSHPRYESDSPFTGAIEDYYKTVDHGIGRLLKEVNDDCDIIVLSDHGFGPLSYDIYIDEWLENNGFLTRRSEGSTRKVFDDVLSTLLRTGWKALGHLNLDSIVKSTLPVSWVEFGKHLQDESHRDIVWEETLAFFTTLSGQGLQVNLEDRFTQGTVSCAQYDEVVEEIRDSIRSIRHPDMGKKLVDAVIRADEAFEGWRLDDAPDLVILTAPGYTMKGGRSETLVQPSAQNAQDRSGDHLSEGILIASGPSFESGTISGASVLDVAPTLLYLHDNPIPTEMDGSVLEEVFRGELFAERQIRVTDEFGSHQIVDRKWNDEEESELEKRLSDMGYLG